MRPLRNINARELIKALKHFGYIETRKTGSHIRLTTMQNGQHHITIPDHDPIKIGTLSAIITEVAIHFNTSKDELSSQLWK